MHFGLLEETKTPEPFMVDPAFVIEEKLDGVRLQIIKSGTTVTGFTRKGREWPVPKAVRDAALSFPASFHADGELVGNEYVTFDVLAFAGLGVEKLANSERRAMVDRLPFRVARRATTEAEKRALLAAIRKENGEGVVFKKDEAYSAGRGYGVKFKFYKTETFRVASIDYSRGSCSIERGGMDCGRVVFRGQWPKPGELCEVRFDAISSNGKLVRPQWLGRREDIDAEAVASPLTR